MHVIARKKIDDAIKKFPNDESGIEDLYKVLKKGRFNTPDELKKVIPSLDNFKYKNKFYVIDINGGNLRMIAFIEFRNQSVFIKEIVNHKEYDKITDKNRKGNK